MGQRPPRPAAPTQPSYHRCAARSRRRRNRFIPGRRRDCRSRSCRGSGTSATPSSETDTNLVEQRAIYYYPGLRGPAWSGERSSATWAEITKDGRPAIQATLKIPEHNVFGHRHDLQELRLGASREPFGRGAVLGALADSAIQRVPALVLKQTEQARGQPLAGAAVPVTNELFWIALSNAEEDVTRNVQLLREGSWFDIPILFSDQTRALITFEKGIPGDKVFETVMATGRLRDARRSPAPRCGNRRS